MGVRGPMPKRAEDIKGHRSAERLRGHDVTPIPSDPATPFIAKQPRQDPEWSKHAKMIWKALRDSTYAKAYRKTDWAIAYNTMQTLTVYEGMDKRSGELLAGIATQFDELLLTEGARRRLKVETPKRDTPLKPPPASRDWTAPARKLWKAAKDTPEITRYYEPTDWAVLHLITSELSVILDPGRDWMSGKLKATLDSMTANLMLTEGTRRRLDIELGGAQTQQTGTTPGELEAQRLFNELEAYLEGVNDVSNPAGSPGGGSVND